MHVYRPLFKLAQMNPAHTAAVFIGLLQGAHKRWRKGGHRLYPPFPDVRSTLYPSSLTPHILHSSSLTPHPSLLTFFTPHPSLLIPHSSHPLSLTHNIPHPSLLTFLTPHTLTPHPSLLTIQIILFKLIGLLFPTSDYQHSVVTPAMLFMGQLLLKVAEK